MNCKLVQECMVEYLLGDLTPSGARLVDTHLNQGCEACQQELDQLRESIDAVYATIPDRRTSAHEVELICQSVVNRHSPELSTGKQDHPHAASSRFTGYDYLLWAASFAAGLLVVLASNGPGPSPPPPASTSASTTNLADEDSEESRNQIVLTSLPATQANALVSGVLLYDRSLRELHFFAPDISEPPAGQRYALKIVQGDTTRIRVIDVDSHGVGRASFSGISPDGATSASIELRPVADTPPGNGGIS